MKRHISYILGSLAIAMLASCVKVDIHPVQVDDTAMVSLTLKSTEPVATRADGDDVKDFNENKINSVQCFFSNDGKTILFSARKDNLGVTNGIVTNLSLEISSADLAKLSSPCHVFAVVNCKELQIPDDEKISTLKETTVTLSKGNTEQESFVMVGTDSEEGLTKSDNTLSGTVYVKRVAAKVNVILKVAESIQVKNGNQTETWLPYFNADEDSKISLTFSGKAKTVLADADIVAETQNPSFNSTDDFEVTATAFDGLETPADNVYTVTMQVPFYTYPMSWDGQNDNNITLRLPWKQVADDGTTVRYATYEYQIPVQYDKKKLFSNNEYELTVTVGILGNLGTTVLTPSYQVVNWGTGEIDAELSRPRYFVVDENKVVMNNVNTYSVGFSSSDLPVTAEIISITKPNYSGRLEGVTTIYYDNDKGKTSVTPTSGNTNPFNVSVSNGKVQLTHTLNNDNTDTKKFDYVPYTIVVRVTSPLGIEETITFVQYPAMYISVDLNTDYDDDNSVNGNRGYAWVNNSHSTLGNLNGYSTSNNNSNPNMITITTTSFNNNDYVIGDPRVGTIDNLSYGNSWVSAPALYGTSPRRLTYYYPTNTSDAAKNTISPKFRIASSYGLTSSISMTDAKRRCASYQEDGYPAGRWRVPTAAELKYIVQLSASGYITILFNNNGDYWAADETIYVPNYTTGTVSEGSGSDAYVRCVYDEWYWGSEKEKTEGQETLTSFTWGDEPREN